MAIDKFPEKCTAFFEAFFGEGYRTHTVPVKKYEPRVFMGKEVPYGATHYIDTGATVLFAKFDEPCTMFGGTIRQLLLCVEDNLTHTTWIPAPSTRYDPTLHTIKELPKQENIMKKEFTKADLKSGYRVQYRKGDFRTVFLNSEYGDILSGNGNWATLSEFGDDLLSRMSEFDIMAVYAPPGPLMTENPSTEFGFLIWKREEKAQEQLAYEALQAQIAEEEARHADSVKALREQAEKLKPKNTP